MRQFAPLSCFLLLMSCKSGETIKTRKIEHKYRSGERRIVLSSSGACGYTGCLTVRVVEQQFVDNYYQWYDERHRRGRVRGSRRVGEPEYIDTKVQEVPVEEARVRVRVLECPGMEATRETDGNGEVYVHLIEAVTECAGESAITVECSTEGGRPLRLRLPAREAERMQREYEGAERRARSDPALQIREKEITPDRVREIARRDNVKLAQLSSTAVSGVLAMAKAAKLLRKGVKLLRVFRLTLPTFVVGYFAERLLFKLLVLGEER